MNLYEKLANRLPEVLNIPDQTLPGVPIIELYADRRVLIEGKCAIMQYDCNCIKLRSCSFRVSICGSGLSITELSGEQLIITGTVDCVSVRRG